MLNSTQKTVESRKRTAEKNISSENSRRKQSGDNVSEELGIRLGTKVHRLTPNGASWYILKRKWLPSKDFDSEWKLHPPNRHKLRLFGKIVEENRWSQSWGVSYVYSGSINLARPIEESPMTLELVETVNAYMNGLIPYECPYNGCLQNWYEPNDTIGLHADSERSLREDCPIWSLSWGGTRRFLFREKLNKRVKTDIFLNDGDLLIMGGTCQLTHYHEVPKRRVTLDPPTSKRINWTIRAFHDRASMQSR
jgi:alkylated DNA repair dioxygenase AlkB